MMNGGSFVMGERIKNMAIFLGVIVVIGAIILGIVYGRDFESYKTPFSFGKFLGIALGVSAGGLIECWLLYAFGDAVSNAQTAVEKIYELEKRIADMQDSMKAMPGGQGGRSIGSAAPASAAPVWYRSTAETGGWTCKRCGHRNRATDMTCTDCGASK